MAASKKRRIRRAYTSRRPAAALCCVAVAASSASADSVSPGYQVIRRNARQVEQEYYRRISAVVGGDNEMLVDRDRSRRRDQVVHKKGGQDGKSAVSVLHNEGDTGEASEEEESITFVSLAVGSNTNTLTATSEASSSETSTDSSAIKNLKNLRATDLRSFQDLRLAGASFIPEEEDRHHYMASLQMEGINPAGTHYDYHVCGGILVAPDFILTSAHCAYYSPPNSNEKYQAFNGIEVGKTDLSYEGLEYDAYSLETYKLYYENLIPEKMYLHPNYNEETYENDMMLVKTYGKSRYPTIKINSQDGVPEGNQDITVLGWGADHADSDPKYSNQLKEADLTTMTNDQCKATAVDVTNPETGMLETMLLTDHISEDMMCAKATNRYICHGDAGGPAIQRADNRKDDVALGIISWGYGCVNEQSPAVMSRISTHYNWIRNIICEDSTAPPDQYDCPRMASMSSSTNTQTVTLKMKLDMMSVETGFVIRFRDTAEVVAQRIPGYYKEDHNLVIQEAIELPAGQCYTLTILDSFGDGHCCNMGGGNGYLYKGTDTSMYTGVLLAEINGNFEFSSSADFCINGQSADANPPPATPPPTPFPITPSPTDEPAVSLSNAVGNVGWSGPVSDAEFEYCTDFCVSKANALRCGNYSCTPGTEAETDEEKAPSSQLLSAEVSDEYYLTVQFQFDEHPEDVSWVLYDLTKNEAKEFVDFGVYNQEGFANERLDILVDINGPEFGENEYAFTVYDKGSNGLCCAFGDGFYKVWLGDEVDGQFLLGDDAYEFSSSYFFTLFEGVEASITANAAGAEAETSMPTLVPTQPPTPAPSPVPTPPPNTNKPTLSPTREPTNPPTTTPTDSPTHMWERQRSETSDAIAMRWSAEANTPPGEFNDVGGNQQQYAFFDTDGADANGATRVNQIVVSVTALLLSALLMFIFVIIR